MVPLHLPVCLPVCLSVSLFVDVVSVCCEAHRVISPTMPAMTQVKGEEEEKTELCEEKLRTLNFTAHRWNCSTSGVQRSRV